MLASGGLQAVKSLREAGSAADPTFDWGPTLAATAIAGVVGYAVIAWLLRYLSTHTFTPFVAYRIAAAAAIYALLGTGVLVASA